MFNVMIKMWKSLIKHALNTVICNGAMHNFKHVVPFDAFYHSLRETNFYLQSPDRS